jgi:hypothetical protein
MKKAVFGLQEKRGPWTFKKTRKTRFRDIFTFRVFGLFGLSPLTGPNERKFYKKKVIKKGLMKKTSPPLARGGRGGGTPHSGRSPELNQPLKSQSRPKKNVNRERFSYAKGY